MEQFHLIIQKTTTGLTVEYKSPGIDPQHPNVIKTLEDERAYATQIVKESDVYSLQITDHYRVYSLIVTDSDKFGRSGFYEFKLYGPGNYRLENSVEILQAIKLNYNENTGTKSYESILSAILITPNNREDNFIAVEPKNKKYYCFYDDNDSKSLKGIFSDKGVMLVKKLYALNRSKAYDENVINSVGLLPFTKGQFKEVSISNPHQVLKELFVNDEILEVNLFKDELKLLLDPKDVLTYSTTDSKIIKTIMGSYVRVERKPPVHIPVQTPHTPTKKKSFLKENGVYILALVIMIVGAGFGFPYYKGILGFESNEKDFSNNQPEVTMDNELEDKQISFYTLEDEFSFKTSYKCLDHYTFKFSDNKWTFINNQGKKEFRDFHQGIVKDLKIDNNPVLDEKEQIEFITALEKASGQSIDPVKIPETKDPVVTTPSPNARQGLIQSKPKEIEKEEKSKQEGIKEVKIGLDTNKDID